jgi:NAD(P)-dependent dehydrogenase (short-subunit alcohol dehydrogenase family)
MSELRFDGKVAIVTGAGAGLGRSHALLLASRGATVVVNDTGGPVAGGGLDTGPADAVAAKIRAVGGRAIADSHSVATADGGAALVRTALDAYGRVDVLVNNAGILRNAPFEEMSEQNLEAVLDVHLRGAFFVTQSAWRAMRDQGGGRIVNTTSSAGLLGNAGFSNYAAAKGGVYGLTRVLGIEGAKYGIKVNAIAPTAATRMLTEAMAPAEVTDEAMLAAMQSIVAAFDPARCSRPAPGRSRVSSWPGVPATTTGTCRPNSYAITSGGSATPRSTPCPPTLARRPRSCCRRSRRRLDENGRGLPYLRPLLSPAGPRPSHSRMIIEIRNLT